MIRQTRNIRQAHALADQSIAYAEEENEIGLYPQGMEEEQIQPEQAFQEDQPAVPVEPQRPRRQRSTRPTGRRRSTSSIPTDLPSVILGSIFEGTSSLPSASSYPSDIIGGSGGDVSTFATPFHMHEQHVPITTPPAPQKERPQQTQGESDMGEGVTQQRHVTEHSPIAARNIAESFTEEQEPEPSQRDKGKGKESVFSRFGKTFTRRKKKD